jgi:hypothetical protein
MPHPLFALSPIRLPPRAQLSPLPPSCLLCTPAADAVATPLGIEAITATTSLPCDLHHPLRASLPDPTSPPRFASWCSRTSPSSPLEELPVVGASPPKPPSPPHHRPATWVSPRRRHLVRLVAATPTVLAPPPPPHLIHRQARADRATTAAHASALGAPYHSGWLGCWARPKAKSQATVRPSTVCLGFEIFCFLL